MKDEHLDPSLECGSRSTWIKGWMVTWESLGVMGGHMGPEGNLEVGCRCPGSCCQTKPDHWMLDSPKSGRLEGV